ncbi:MAG: S-layer homology domain-containing protein [Oculatellaceae cyanobacterium Prado106]|jgi:peptidoglycan hydrolase-like protein with peptidoglycan-binding domain|nr:S-layer homology domain-containing protein [Oculatellaceae cyanobacterium Prado106]
MPSTATLVTKPELQFGAQGAEVRELQTLLNRRLQNLYPAIPVDGGFGMGTENAVIAYQEMFCLPQTGIAGRWTWNSLLQTSLDDIVGHWAVNYILQLFNAEVVDGDDVGKFNPDAPISRAQFAAMLVKGFAPLPLVRPGKEFPDVPRNFWGHESIQTAYRAGLLSGYDDGTFKPGLSLLRQDAVIAIANPLGKPAATRDLSLYDDRASISDYAVAGVVAATSHRIVVNFPGRSLLTPKKAATRAEVAAFLARARTVYWQSGKTLNFRVSRQPMPSAFVV